MPIYEEAFSSQAVWSDLSAVRDGGTVFLPPDLFLYKPNARWDKAYQYVYDVLFPQ